MRRSKDSEDNVTGISPLGGNGVEGTGPGLAPIRDSSIIPVPLFWDDRTQSYISEQAIKSLNNREKGLVAKEEYNQEREFLNSVGIRKA